MGWNGCLERQSEHKRQLVPNRLCRFQFFWTAEGVFADLRIGAPAMTDKCLKKGKTMVTGHPETGQMPAADRLAICLSQTGTFWKQSPNIYTICCCGALRCSGLLPPVWFPRFECAIRNETTPGALLHPAGTGHRYIGRTLTALYCSAQWPAEFTTYSRLNKCMQKDV